MSLLSFTHPRRDDARGPAAALEALLVRLQERWYVETLPALGSCWLRTLCCSGHNRPWWVLLRDDIDRTLLENRVDDPSRGLLISARNWIESSVLTVAGLPAGRQYVDPPYRSLRPERLLPYIGRLLNEWLPAEVARLLTEEEQYADAMGDGIPVLARVKALDRLLIREHLSPDTLELLLTGEILSPRLVDPADVEILRDVVLALLGRICAPAIPILPAEFLAAATGAVIPPDFPQKVNSASLVRNENGGEELHVPISDQDATEVLRHDPVRIGSIIVTMDGRAWQPCSLDRSDSADGNRIIYRPGERLRIDYTADHARLTVKWPEMPSSWSGGLPPLGPFELFGREWHAASWEMDGESTLLHLTFSRVLQIPEPEPEPADRVHLHQANVDMAWSELERTLAEAVARASADPVEQMHRSDLIPLGRSLYALSESLQGAWPSKDKQIERHLQAARYHHASVAPVYGQVPWRVLPVATQATLARLPWKSESIDFLTRLFAGVPLERVSPPSPSQAA